MRFLSTLWRLLRGRCADGQPVLSKRGALFFTVLWWTLVFDAPFFSRILGLPNNFDAERIDLAIGCAAALFLVGAALAVLIGLLPKLLGRLVLVLLNTCGAAAFCATLLYGVSITPDMVRNLFATDVAEATGYVSPRTTAVFLASWLPVMWAALVFGRKRRPGFDIELGEPRHGVMAGLKRALLGTVAALALAGASVAVILLNFQEFSGAMRADKALRYQIAPVNAVYSAIRTAVTDDSPDSTRFRAETDPSPKRTVTPERATMFVVVLGETTRSANWALSGYERETNPELMKRPIISFPHVLACGTSTDVSLPCMLSRIGRSDYDRARILAEDALPDVLARSGFKVEWIDNQSGCKGTCAGVPNRRPDPKIMARSASCPKNDDGKCFDGVLVDELVHAVSLLQPGEAQVLFLHMMGSHGPAYKDRSPEDMKAFRPECQSPDLGSCSEAEIRNAYDNSVRYTDHVLAKMIDVLGAAKDVDAALVFVSDHGESLGENGLFLHGAPYYLAPDEQKLVPMTMWFSEGFAADYGVPVEQLTHIARNAGEKVTHEHLYSTILGLLGVESRNRRATFDLTAPLEFEKP